MILRIGDKEKTISADGTITAYYLNGQTEVINLKNVKYVYLNPERVISVTMADKEK